LTNKNEKICVEHRKALHLMLDQTPEIKYIIDYQFSGLEPCLFLNI
jgi:hypothetical protein